MAFVVKSVVAERTGCHTGERHKLSPLVWFPHKLIVFTNRAVILFGVQSTVFAHGIFQHQIKHRPHAVAAIAIDLNRVLHRLRAELGEVAENE